MWFLDVAFNIRHWAAIKFWLFHGNAIGLNSESKAYAVSFHYWYRNCCCQQVCIKNETSTLSGNSWPKNSRNNANANRTVSPISIWTVAEIFMCSDNLKNLKSGMPSFVKTPAALHCCTASSCRCCKKALVLESRVVDRNQRIFRWIAPHQFLWPASFSWKFHKYWNEILQKEGRKKCVYCK